MSRGSGKFICTEDDIFELKRIAARQNTDSDLSKRAKIILLLNEGMLGKDIAHQLDTTPNVVSKWRRRYIEEGIRGLISKPTRECVSVTAENRDKLLALIKQDPPQGYEQWTAELLAEKIGISSYSIWKLAQAEGIHLNRQRSWQTKTSDKVLFSHITIAGLFLSHTERGIILCTTEKNTDSMSYVIESRRKEMADSLSVAASQDAEPLTLIRALDIAEQHVDVPESFNRKRISFFEFLDSVVSGIPSEQHAEYHAYFYRKSAICYDTEWMIDHPNVFIHETDDETVWTYQADTLYSCLGECASQMNKADSYPLQLTQSISSFVRDSTQKTEPFVWKLAS